MSDLSDNTDAINRLNDTLKEIYDWLLSHRRESASPPTAPARSTAIDDLCAQMRCPLCNGPMAVRTARATNEQFMGCKAFPGCTGTRDKSGRDTSRGKPRPVRASETEPLFDNQGHNDNDFQDY